MTVMLPEDGYWNAGKDHDGIMNWNDSDFKKTVLRFTEASLQKWIYRQIYGDTTILFKVKHREFWLINEWMAQ